MSRAAVAYVCAVVILGVSVLAVAAGGGSVPWGTVVLLAGLYWIADAAPVRTSVRSLTISIAFPVGLAAVLLLGPWSGALVCWVGAGTGGRKTAWYKRAFNGSQMALSAVVAGYVYDAIPGSNAAHFEHVRFPQALPAVVVAGVAFCVVNYLLVATAISLSGRLRLARVWRSGLSEIAAPSLGYGLLGLVIAVLWSGGVGPVAALLVLVPLLIARWAFRQYGEQHKAYEATVASLIQAVETKDYYTRGHSERVAKASVMLAERLGMRGERLEMLRYAGMLHDVGKLGVPTKLLQKTGPLDDREFAAIRQHPSRGFEMVEGISFLEDAMLAIRHHHERVDGTGYPDGLAGEAIPEFARVIAVADAFDSMTSTRSYRGARTVPAAVAELRQWAGTQFDATMVEALVAAVAAHGWQVSADPVQEIVAPDALVFGDHDDPSSRVAAFDYRVRDARAEVS
jgi:putative nucleotidyltransferase with HDIG domain